VVSSDVFIRPGWGKVRSGTGSGTFLRRSCCSRVWFHVFVRDGQAESGLLYEDLVFRLCFARLVTHYWRHAAWLEEGALLADVHRLAGIPGVLVHGRLDLSSPLDVPWDLARSWTGCELVVVDQAGHTGGPDMTDVIVSITDRFARSGK
jgi:proline iminopeptidase